MAQSVAERRLRQSGALSGAGFERFDAYSRGAYGSARYSAEITNCLYARRSQRDFTARNGTSIRRHYLQQRMILTTVIGGEILRYRFDCAASTHVDLKFYAILASFWLLLGGNCLLRFHICRQNGTFNCRTSNDTKQWNS